MKIEQVIRMVGEQPASVLSRIATPRDTRTVIELLEEWAASMQRREVDKMVDILSVEHVSEVVSMLQEFHDAHGYNA